MGKAPAVIVIARHGARLDAENSAWISASPTPYDPPLSYGGWTQTRALGARIASLLHARDISLEEDDAASKRRVSDATGGRSSIDSDHSKHEKKSKRKKRKIVIHSSPFLRCLQSSIAISAGLTQYEGNLHRFDTDEHPEPNKQPKLFSTPVRSKTMDTTALERKYGTSRGPHLPESHNSVAATDIEPSFQKPLLRVDAFLGEWLTPNYYEHMTPPPPSSKMISVAKALLTSAATPIPGAQASNLKSSSGGKNHEKHAESHVSFAMDALTEALNEDEVSQTETGGRLNSSNGSTGREYHKTNSTSIGYQPPTPNYAILSSDAIPDGYVAHARDACITSDREWDSTTEPQIWGDGGEYGEEWSSMHKRFRSGLADMVEWYKEHDHLDSSEGAATHLDVDEDCDLVLVIVTHGAGCNALIGALTNQPVLLDVGMGSLTMAVRRDTPLLSTAGRPRPTPTSQRRHSSIDYSHSDEYDMKIVASTEHLRAGADPLHIPALQAPRAMSSIAEHSRPRGKTVSNSTSNAPTVTELDRPRSKNSALGSIRRIRPTINPTYTKPPNYDDVTSPGSAGGLWGGRRSSVQDNRRPSVQDNRRTSIHEEGVSPSSAGQTSAVDLENNGLDGSGGTQATDRGKILPSPVSLGRRDSQRGLWGGTPKEETKRRWTIQEDK